MKHLRQTCKVRRGATEGGNERALGGKRFGALMYSWSQKGRGRSREGNIEGEKLTVVKEITEGDCGAELAPKLDWAEVRYLKWGTFYQGKCLELQEWLEKLG